MKRDDLPPPIPGAPIPMPAFDADEATMLAHGALPDAYADDPDDPDADDAYGERDAVDLPDLPDAPPQDPRLSLSAGTGAKMLQAVADSAPDNDPYVRQQQAQQRRMPAPRDRRPTLMPSGYDMPPKLPTAPRLPDPALVRPLRSAPDSSKPSVGAAREASDVIQMFSSSSSPVPTPMQARPQRPHPVPPPQQGQGQGQGSKLIRRAPGPAAQPAQPQPYRPQPSQPPAASAPHQISQYGANVAQFGGSAAQFGGSGQAALPGVLPLLPERMVGLIADHRARLATLDMFARGLEIGAGLFGTVSLAVLIASLVSLLVGAGVPVVVAATAIVTSCGGLAMTGTMVAIASGLRHQAHTGAQVAALLEALSAPPR